MRWALALFLIGCAGPPAPVAAVPRAPVVAPVEERTVAPRAMTRTVCERASECCNSYVEAIIAGTSDGEELRANLEEACAAPAAIAALPTADESCRVMIHAYRQALEALQRPVPAACQDIGEGCCATGPRR